MLSTPFTGKYITSTVKCNVPTHTPRGKRKIDINIKIQLTLGFNMYRITGARNVPGRNISMIPGSFGFWHNRTGFGLSDSVEITNVTSNLMGFNKRRGGGSWIRTRDYSISSFVSMC